MAQLHSAQSTLPAIDVPTHITTLVKKLHAYLQL